MSSRVCPRTLLPLWSRQVGSRFQSGTVTPSFLLRLDTEDSGMISSVLCPDVAAAVAIAAVTTSDCVSACLCAAADATLSSVYMQSDFANLARLKAKLEQAAAELEKPHAKRITRYIR